MTDPIKEVIERGEQAVEFLKFVEEHPYFKNMIQDRKDQIAAAILSLRPEQRDEFYSLKFQMEMLDFPLSQAEADAKLGVMTQEKMKPENVPKQEGIL